MQQTESSTTIKQPPKQPYVSPTLVEYGTIAELTGNTGTPSGLDMGFYVTTGA